ncbi:hypothetical protein THRCLA_05232 [Thraustotheca clavata]|uniref:Uncharacterized protein n=1 Tax=Thraustotheca clavata TaxID=74557 RepID=A0A1V9ZX70_9STRA|nr:hypothetical protein THRCLA_05232 [Thraustotheca clavata]
MTDSADRDNYKIIHPKEHPPRSVASLWVEKCSVQPSLLPGVPKQLSFELKSPMCPPSRPRYRRAGMCKRQDTIKGILEYDTCYQTKHQSLVHVVPKLNEHCNSRESLRLVRDRTVNEKATHLAERLLVEDATSVLKKKTAHYPPWSKEY